MTDIAGQTASEHKPREDGRLLAKNTAALGAANVYAIAASAISVPLLARYLGREGYGVYSEVYALVQLFTVVSHLGTQVIVTREIARARDRASSVLGQVLTMQLILGGVFLGTVAIAGWASSVTRQIWPLLGLCAAENVLRVLSNTAMAALRGYELMEYELVATAVDRTLWLAGLACVVVVGLGLSGVFAVFLLSALARLIVAFRFCWRRIPKPRLGVEPSTWKAILGEAWPIGAGQGARQASERVGIIQLAGSADAGTLGLFSSAVRVFHLTDVLTASFSTALFPAMSEAATEASGRLSDLVSDGLRVQLSLTLPLAASYFVFGTHFVPWLLGSEFKDAAVVLQILAPAVVLAAVSTFLSNLLRASGRQRYDLYCLAAALAITVMLGLLLIPSLGYLGPAIAIVVSYGAYVLLAGIVALRRLRRLNGRKLLAPVIATAAMLIAWQLLASLPLVVRFLLGTMVYSASLFLLGGVDPRIVHLLTDLGRSLIRALRPKSR